MNIKNYVPPLIGSNKINTNYMLLAYKMEILDGFFWWLSFLFSVLLHALID